MSKKPFSTQYEDLPEVLPVFPLSQVVLLPGGRLPLTIFEPRYLALINDALCSGRLFGIIQPVSDETEDGAPPEIYTVGSVGRIVHFSETENNNFIVVTLGICRFEVIEELDLHEEGYRRMRVNYAPYMEDVLSPAGGTVSAPRERLTKSLERYVQAHNLDIDLQALDALSTPSLVVTLSMALPFEAPEKQALIEAPTLEHRFNALCVLMEMGAVSALGSGDTQQ